MSKKRDMWPDPENRRKWKRAARRAMGAPEMAVHEAYAKGEEHAERGKPKRNPYPAGRRHEAYEAGYNYADPMGDYHGSNV